MLAILAGPEQIKAAPTRYKKIHKEVVKRRTVRKPELLPPFGFVLTFPDFDSGRRPVGVPTNTGKSPM